MFFTLLVLTLSTQPVCLRTLLFAQDFRETDSLLHNHLWLKVNGKLWKKSIKVSIKWRTFASNSEKVSHLRYYTLIIIMSVKRFPESKCLDNVWLNFFLLLQLKSLKEITKIIFKIFLTIFRRIFENSGKISRTKL